MFTFSCAKVTEHKTYNTTQRQFDKASIRARRGEGGGNLNIFQELL